ncbi:MAG: RluA family pseudouridine synthase [Rhodospirillales bacterium]
MSGVKSIEVAADEQDIRLDRWFKRHYPELPHARLQKLLRTGQVRIDGKRAKGNFRLKAGQSVRVPPMDDGERPTAASRPPPKALDADETEALLSSVIHQDDHVIVINKPSGLAVQGGSKVRKHIDAMLDAFIPGGGERPKLAHRLDKDTSGILVLGRTASATARLAEAFRYKEAQKLYWAVVVGAPRPSKGRIDLALSKRPGPGGERMAPDGTAGKPAITDYRIIEKAGRKIAWLALRPRTGRTHQLRAHCLALGTPILGDGKFGGSTSFLAGFPKKLHLHARALRIPHPAGGVLEVAAPIPAHMRETWEMLDFDEDYVEAGFFDEDD